MLLKVVTDMVGLCLLRQPTYRASSHLPNIFSGLTRPAALDMKGKGQQKEKERKEMLSVSW